MERARRATLALVATTLAASGCGSGTKTPSQTTTPSLAQPPLPGLAAQHRGPLTRAELIAAADAICYRVNVVLGQSKLRTPRDFARVMPPIGAYEEKAVAQMRKLIPPASMRRSWTQIVNNAKILADSIVTIGRDVMESSDIKRAHEANVRAGKARQLMLATAQREGFKDCAH
jgi:hypothetical protein